MLSLANGLVICSAEYVVNKYRLSNRLLTGFQSTRRGSLCGSLSSGVGSFDTLPDDRHILPAPALPVKWTIVSGSLRLSSPSWAGNTPEVFCAGRSHLRESPTHEERTTKAGDPAHGDVRHLWRGIYAEPKRFQMVFAALPILRVGYGAKPAPKNRGRSRGRRNIVTSFHVTSAGSYFCAFDLFR
jgi:hypothetical protein